MQNPFEIPSMTVWKTPRGDIYHTSPYCSQLDKAEDIEAVEYSHFIDPYPMFCERCQPDMDVLYLSSPDSPCVYSGEPQWGYLNRSDWLHRPV